MDSGPLFACSLAGGAGASCLAPLDAHSSRETGNEPALGPPLTELRWHGPHHPACGGRAHGVWLQQSRHSVLPGDPFPWSEGAGFCCMSSPAISGFFRPAGSLRHKTSQVIPGVSGASPCFPGLYACFHLMSGGKYAPSTSQQQRSGRPHLPGIPALRSACSTSRNSEWQDLPMAACLQAACPQVGQPPGRPPQSGTPCLLTPTKRGTDLLLENKTEIPVLPENGTLRGWI